MVCALFVMIVIVLVLLRETLCLSSFMKKRLVFFSQKTKSFRSHWPTLKTSRDINSNEPRKKNDINRDISSVCITRARLVSFYSLLCTSRERQRRSILAFSLVFFVCVWEKCFTCWRRRISISKDVKHNALLYYDRDSIHTYIREKETDDLRVITTRNKRMFGTNTDDTNATMVRRAQPGLVLCCLCATSISPNPTGMCVECIKTRVDITEGIQKQCSVIHCNQCARYLQPPKHWIRADLESKELLTFCIKRVKGLNKVKLVDAGFVWTEPHSKRLKTKLTVQKEVLNGAILQQSFVVEYVVEWNMCDACARAAANADQWQACVQVRQKVEHKRTFLFLEQLILKHSMEVNAIGVKSQPDGLDFYYGHRSHGLKMVDFIGSVLPIRSRNDKQLVSHDANDNTYNYRFTLMVEIVPMCREDLVCLPPKTSKSFGGIGPVVLCTRVGSSMQFTETHTLRRVWLNSEQYWRYPFVAVANSKQLCEYIVLDLEIVNGNEWEQNGGDYGLGENRSQLFNGSQFGGNASTIGGKQRRANRKNLLADVTVARSRDFGTNDITFFTRTHLGSVLKVGDTALGYDLTNVQISDESFDSYVEKVGESRIPDVVLVKKSYAEKRKKRRDRGYRRAWELKRMDINEEEETNKKDDAEKRMQDEELFMQELEEDFEGRAQINVYKKKNEDLDAVIRANQNALANDTDDEDDDENDEIPEIKLEELLDDMKLSDVEEEEEEEEMEMEIH